MIGDRPAASIALVAGLLTVMAGSGWAQEAKAPAPERPKDAGALPALGAPGRYTFHPVDGGVLRLDRETGAVSLCTTSAGAARCVLAADDKAALEAEIARLTEANRQLLARAIPAPPDATLPGGPGKRPQLALPSDAEIDTALDFLESTMRRLKERMEKMASPRPPASGLPDRTAL